MNGKKIVGNGSKATLPGGQKLSDKIQENKTKQGLNNNQNKSNNSANSGNNKNQNSSQDKNNGEKGKSKTDNAMQQGGTEAARVALKAFAASNPYTAWIPQGIRDKIVDKIVDSNLGQQVIEKQGKKLKTQIVLVVIAAVGSVLFGILMIAVIYTVLMAPFAWLSDATKGLESFFSSLGHWFAGDGWCPTDDVCNKNAEEEYYETLNKLIEKYNNESGNGCLINEDLITGTIFYAQIMDEEKGSKDEEEQGGYYFNYLDVSEQVGHQHASAQVKKLVKAYFKGSDDLTEDESQDDFKYTSCSVNTRSYRQYLIDKYIPEHYESIVNPQRTAEDIADEILKMGNISLINRAFSSSIYCPSIAVEQKDGSIESMDLEDYVARVVTSENNWYEGDNIENMKAQAIAARTFALNATSNCKNSIKNSSLQQTLADTASSMAIRAAEETNSLVLLQDGKVFSTMYDALAIASSDDTNYYLKQANLAIPKTWLDERITQKQYEWYTEHNHGQGMSQWGSRYLQTIGKNYEDILGTFYTMAEISKMGGLISGGNYSSDMAPAVDVNELAERRDYYKSIGIDYIYSASASNVSQCPWYAKSRAIEIVYNSNMDDTLKNTAIESLRKTHGNGADWYNTPDATIFTKTTDYTQIQPGSIVSWSTSSKEGASCHDYGHVAIVEQVLENGKVLISEGWNKGGADSGNNWSKVAYSVREVSMDYIKSHKNSSGCTYTFNGYVYLLG